MFSGEHIWCLCTLYYDTLLHRCTVITLHRCGGQFSHECVKNCIFNIAAKCYQVWCTFGKVIAKMKRVHFYGSQCISIRLRLLPADMHNFVNRKLGFYIAPQCVQDNEMTI